MVARCQGFARWSLLAAVVACGPGPRSGGTVDSNGGSDGGGGDGGGSSYIVYAHSDTTLYSIDLEAKTLVTVGPFDAPDSDTMTDLAVSPNGTIYTISETALYTVSATTGAVTQVGTLSACGDKGVALTTTPSGELFEGDFKGNICQIDISSTPPTVGAPVMMGSGIALSGDMVAVSDGTVFGTAYRLTDPSGEGTQANNLLIELDLTSGAVTVLGSTGYPELFGTAFQNGVVFGFTHDGTGRVVTLDTTTGAGTLFGTFTDPATGSGIAFAGAGVSSLVGVVE